MAWPTILMLALITWIAVSILLGLVIAFAAWVLSRNPPGQRLSSPR